MLYTFPSGVGSDPLGVCQITGPPGQGWTSASGLRAYESNLHNYWDLPHYSFRA